MRTVIKPTLSSHGVHAVNSAAVDICEPPTRAIRFRQAERLQPKAPIRELLTQLARLSDRYSVAPDSSWNEIGLATHLAQAMVTFFHDPNPVCLPAIDASYDLAQHNRRLQPSISLGLVRAIVLLRSGNEEGAMEVGRRMVDAAEAAGLTRILPDLGAPVLPLVVRLLRQERDQRRRDFLEAARREIEGGEQGSHPDHAPASETPTLPVGPLPAQVELLSVREQDILELLARAMSTKSIARTLDIAPGTVKWHLKNIFGKLNAISREDVLIKARDLRILA